MITDEDRIRMGTVAEELAEAVRQSPLPDLTGGESNPTALTIRANRAAHLARLRHLYLIPGPIPDQVVEKDYQVTVRDGTSIRVRVYTPVASATTNEGRPLVVMFHEGGWMFGDLTDEELNCRLFARDLGAVCVNVEYRLAPEHVYPTQAHDCYDVVSWCAKIASPESDILPADLRRGFIVGGGSAGGNLAAVMCQVGRDEGLSPPLTGQYLCVPSVMWSDVVPERWQKHYRSRWESKDDPVLKYNDNDPGDFTRANVQPDTSNPLFCPAINPNLRGLPPAYLQLAGLDPLRDEALIYDEMLRDNDIATRVEVYDGFGHMFWTNWPLMKRSRKFVGDTREGIRWLIEIHQKGR